MRGYVRADFLRTLGVLALVGTIVFAPLAFMPQTKAALAGPGVFDSNWDYTNYLGTPKPSLDSNGTVEAIC